MITPENLHIHELTGLRARVIRSGNPQITGLAGTIIDETRNMFCIESDNTRRSIPKAGSTWGFSAGGQAIEMDGSLLAKRPYDRLGGKV